MRKTTKSPGEKIVKYVKRALMSGAANGRIEPNLTIATRSTNRCEARLAAIARRKKRLNRTIMIDP